MSKLLWAEESINGPKISRKLPRDWNRAFALRRGEYPNEPWQECFYQDERKVLLKCVKRGGVYAERCSISSLPHTRQVEPHYHITYGVWRLHIAVTHLACKVRLGWMILRPLNTTALGTKIASTDTRIWRRWLRRLPCRKPNDVQSGKDFPFQNDVK